MSVTPAPVESVTTFEEPALEIIRAVPAFGSIESKWIVTLGSPKFAGSILTFPVSQLAADPGPNVHLNPSFFCAIAGCVTKMKDRVTAANPRNLNMKISGEDNVKRCLYGHWGSVWQLILMTPGKLF